MVQEVASVLNAFLQATMDVLRAETGWEMRRGTPTAKVTDQAGGELVIVVGLAGQMEGVLILHTRSALAKKLASRMLGREVPEHDGLVDSAVAEIGNMVAGRATMYLEQEGVQCDITPPSVVRGRNLVVTPYKTTMVEVPVETEAGEIGVQVGITSQR